MLRIDNDKDNDIYTHIHIIYVYSYVYIHIHTHTNSLGVKHCFYLLSLSNARLLSAEWHCLIRLEKVQHYGSPGEQIFTNNKN